MNEILQIKNLSIHFNTDQGQMAAVRDISISLQQGASLGIVGESGSGKSVTALSVMRLLASPPAKIDKGQILFTEQAEGAPIDLLQVPEKAIEKIRGKKVSMIFQEPMTSLNPVFRCGHQVTEAIRLHQQIGFAEAKAQALELFRKVKLPDPERIFQAFPHEISGGQKQRVLIAMAISCQPSILIADEPTTALDVTVQKTILDLLREIREEAGLSLIFISHDLGVISEVCDQVAVMFKGEIVETGTVENIFKNPQHPYTRGLLACRPSLQQKLERLPTIQNFLEDKNHQVKVVSRERIQARQETLYAQEPLLRVEHLHVRFPGKKNWLGRAQNWVHAVEDMSFEIYPGETFGLVGESGCGKTTLGRALARLTPMQEGKVFFDGQEISALSDRAFKPFRKDIQVVFQDPYASLNPRMTVGQAISEPMEVHQLYPGKNERTDKTIELLETVGLQADHFNRYPHEFSGGQRQRICLARALALNPRFIVCDEMVSALDVSVQATILNLLAELQEKFGLSYLFISHDLSVVKQMCDRLLIMQNGRQNAIGFPETLFETPPTPYVSELIGSIPGV